MISNYSKDRGDHFFTVLNLDDKFSVNTEIEAMAEELKKGDQVEWDTPQGKTEGVIQEKITEPRDFKHHHFEASEEKPEYLVESNKSGKDAIHRPEELKKVKQKKE